MADTAGTLKRKPRVKTHAKTAKPHAKPRLKADSLKGLIVKCLESEGSLSLQALQRRVGEIEGKLPLAHSLDVTLRRLRRDDLVKTRLIDKEVLETLVQIRVFELTPAGQEALIEAESRMNKWAMA